MFQNVEKAYHLLENESDRERINAKLTGVHEYMYKTPILFLASISKSKQTHSSECVHRPQYSVDHRFLCTSISLKFPFFSFLGATYSSLWLKVPQIK